VVSLTAVPWLQAADAPALGLVKEKPASGRFIETKQGFMVPYETTIPGTEIKFRMEPIPGGVVKVGSPAGEPGRKPDEGAQVEVQLEPYWMGAYEVTWAEYMRYMAMHDLFKELSRLNIVKVTPEKKDLVVTAPSNLYEPDFTFKKGDDPKFPAVTMSQFAARQYTCWLSGLSGQFYRLPSEAEWEHACRAGATTAYHFGDDPKALGDYAWFYGNSTETMHKVGEKKPNAWGLFDMHGNVGEWTLEAYQEKGRPAANKVLTGAEAIQWPTKLYPRVLKGGGWDQDAAQCRVASRRASQDDPWRKTDPNIPQSPWWFTEEAALSVGFRVVRPLADLPRPEKKKYWDSDLAEQQEIIDNRIDREGRGARGLAEPSLVEALKQVE
jgi:sulfatase modifying factor 1